MASPGPGKFNQVNDVLSKPDVQLAQCQLLLLFTYKMTLQGWKESGLLDREVRYYCHLVEALNHISFLTYGVRDKNYEGLTSPISVWPRPESIGAFRFSLTAPSIYPDLFKRATIIKSNQSLGAWTGLIARCHLPDKLFVVRCGWVRTGEMMRRDERLSGLSLWWAQLVEKLDFVAADAIIVTTEADRSYLAGIYGIDPDKIYIIPNSIDTDLFRPVGSHSPSDWQSQFTAMCVSRFDAMKNLDQVILALKGMKNCKELILVGDGPQRPYLEELARLTGVPVCFVGRVANHQLPDLLRKTNIFIMPRLMDQACLK